MMNPLAQMVANALAADLRIVSFNIEPCALCYGRRVQHAGSLIQIKHDRACPAALTPLGSHWADQQED